MLDFHVQLVSILRHLEPTPEQREQIVGEVLFWPELLSFANRRKILERDLPKLAEAILKEADATDFHERQIPGPASLGALDLELEPPHETNAWREPVPLHFDLVSWEHDGSTVIYVPALGIEVVTREPEEAGSMLEEHVRTAILRSGAAKSLLGLASLQRTRSTELSTNLVNLYPESPKERWDRFESDEKPKGELQQVGLRMDPLAMPEIWCYEDLTQRLAQMLTGRRATSVLLVGPPGVGKTALVHELVRNKSKLGLEREAFWKTSGARIVAGMSGFGDWQQRCQRIAQEAREQNAILYFGNLTELLETGRAGSSSENIAGFFRPRMVRGEILAILECTPEQLGAIEKRDPRILDGMRQLKLQEPSQETALRILSESARHEGKGPADDEVLQRINTLHRRYHGYSAYPGKPLRFLKRLLKRHGTSKSLAEREVNEAFSAETGLPIELLEDSIPLDLDETNVWFRKRLMGQDLAVQCIVDTVAMIKARLSRPGKPLASFLFVGPTGVGKTELAKCLAEFFYGSRDRMIRVDMSEYNAPGSATRLVSTSESGHEGLLTAQMRDQPFSVVLLDEFEKAHTSVFDLFLQVLGEARLTDGAGRVADFGNAVVIMTSNLGSQSFAAGNQLGFGGPDRPGLGAEEHFSAEAKKLFRPEFFNRIDRIVPFLPLTREVLAQIVKKEVAAIHQRDGLRERRLFLELSQELTGNLLEEGFDPRYGARPLRRFLDQRVLRRVAEELNENAGREQGVLRIDARAQQFSREGGGPADRKSHSYALEAASELRRQFQHLRRATFVSELNSERYRLERAIEHHRRTSRGAPAEVNATYARKQVIDELLDRLESLSNRVLEAEESLLIEFTRGELLSDPALGASQADFDSLLIDLYAASESTPPGMVVVFQAEDRDLMFRAAEAYLTAAQELGCEADLAHFRKRPAPEHWDAASERLLPEPLASDDVPSFLESAPAESLALALHVHGGHAFLFFRSELGGHEFEPAETDGRKRLRLVLQGLEQKLDEAWLDLESLHRPALKTVSVHRHYSDARPGWRDSRSGTSGGDPFSPALLAELMTEELKRQAEAAL